MKRRQRWLWALVFAWVCFAAPAAEALLGPGQGGTAEARAGADPDDVEMAVRGLNASVSIFNLTQGMNFRSKNNRMCFVSGTPVETQDGPRAIEQVREGDWVLSWDEAKDELCWSRVEQTFATPGQPVFRLTLKLPDGSEESLECTAGHPFWVEGEGWVHASELGTDSEVATLEGVARVASIVPTGRRATVYNFEVEGTHCYFAGETGLLAHNGCTAGGGAKVSNIAPGDRVRIQNAVNRTKVQVTVVGSRARGTAGPVSDWDYVLKGGTSRSRHSIKSSLPEGPPRGISEGPNREFQVGGVDKSEPHITFEPD